MIKKFLFLLLLSLTAVSLAQQKRISDRLQDVMNDAKSDDYIRTLVIMNDQVDVASMDEAFYRENASLQRRSIEVTGALKEKAEFTQSNLISWLETQEAAESVFRFEPFWVVNMIMVEGRVSVINEIALRSEVFMVDLDGRLERDLPVEVKPASDKSINGSEPGISIINAHKLWQMGITGAGRILMNIDTGVDVTHPALSYKWRGTHVPASQAWYAATGGSTPTDCDGHGTHTMGTMVGMVAGDTVGIAYNAEWIGSNSLCVSGSHTSASVASFQWAMDPDGNPATIDDMPDAISNSWYDPGISNDCSSIYVNTLNAVEAVGIAVVFSAGNSGPGTSTITSPKNINTDEVNIWATAAIDGAQYLAGNTSPIASFSSRGPSTCGGTGSLLIKPEGSAPGVSVRSSYGGGGYSLLSGTSMAAPHVAGAIALLREFAPALTGKQLKMALYNTAKDLGTAGEDNNYGVGLIDVYAAMLTLGTPDPTPPDPVVDLAVSDPTSNSLLLTWTVPYDSSMNGVTGYDIRYSTTPIADTNDFNGAMELTYAGQPAPFGTQDNLLVTGLDFSTTYYFAMKAFDIWGNASLLSNFATGSTWEAPVATVDPPSITAQLAPGTNVVKSFDLSNESVSNSTLEYQITTANNTFPVPDAVSIKLKANFGSVENLYSDKNNPVERGGYAIEGAGGPDLFGYQWIDSDEPDGPVYQWDDIAATGTEVTNWTPTGTFNALDEGYAGPFDFGFNFKYYGNVRTQIFCSSNGFLSFAPLTSNSFSNATIPSTAEPNDIILPFWDDLDGKTTGKVYYKAEGNKFTIQYNEWLRYSGTGTYTYQVVIYSSGKIMFYYKSMTGSVTGASVGMENVDGTDGLQMAYNAAYIHDNLAVKISAEPDWLSLQHTGGILYSGNYMTVDIGLASEDFPQGLYTMDVVINSNDPVNPEIVVPVTMIIGQGSSGWTSELSLVDPNGMEAGRVLTFGQDYLATDGIDPELGEYELPPVPPAGVFDARYQLPGGVGSPVDIRSFQGEEPTWVIKFQAGSAGYPITFSWDPQSLPFGAFNLVDPFGGSLVNVDMKENSSYQVTDPAYTTLYIVFSEQVEASMDVNAGWNMLSMPIVTSDMSVTELFPEATSQLFAFNDGYVVSEMFEMGTGYWLKFPAADSYTFAGATHSGPVALASGWNMIAPYHSAVPVSAVTTDPAGIISSVFFGFDDGYYIAENLMPGKGYWVKTTAEGNMILGGPVAKSGNKVNPISSDWAKILVTDAAGRSGALYLTMGNSSNIEMPPVPPAGVFDVRFSGNYLSQQLTSSPAQFNISGAVFPVKVRIDGAEVSLRDAVTGQVLGQTLSEGGEIVLTDSRVSALEVMSLEIPESYTLAQNYPNPFNPSTKISFAVPVDAKVVVRVFNALGQQVSEVANNVYSAGRYEVNFNASNITSGVYFYTIDAKGIDGTTYSDVKKMMLMK